MKKILSFFWAIVLCIGMAPMTVQATTSTFAGGSGTTENPYLISTATHLNNIRNDMNAHYKLIADITFTDADFAEGGAYYNNGIGWIPIGEQSTPFSGVFDGNGYSITGLYCKLSNKNISEHSMDVYGGLFGYIESASIQNLGMENGLISTSATSSYLESTGGIVGQADNSEILNCYNTGVISSKNGALSRAGGIVGYSKNSKIINCYNTGEVSSVVGSYSTSYAGGIVGDANNSEIINCYNDGKISSSSALGGNRCSAGGIAGYAKSNITYCYNTGTINCSTGSIGSTGPGYAGGIVGYANESDIKKCSNKGYIDSVSPDQVGAAGGIAAYASNTGIIDSYNAGNVKIYSRYTYCNSGGITGYATGSDIINCYNVGKVTCTSYEYSSSSYKGGIVGRGGNTAVTNCYYKDTEKAGVGYGTDTATKCTDAQLQSPATFNGFNFANVWAMESNSNYPYPVLIKYEALKHSWIDADCDTPKTCEICGATEGEALGHNWSTADCDTPKTCKICGETNGDAAGHVYSAGLCTVCGNDAIITTMDGTSFTLSGPLTENTRILVAGYDSYDRFSGFKEFVWCKNILEEELPLWEKIKLFFLDTEWIPLRKASSLK